MHDQDIGLNHEQRDRRKIAHGIERQFRVHRRVRRDRRGAAHEQHVTVGGRLCYVVGADVAAGAGPVLHDKRASHALGEFLAHDPRDDVDAAAGGVRHYHAHRFRRVTLCEHDSACRAEYEGDQA